MITRVDVLFGTIAALRRYEDPHPTLSHALARASARSIFGRGDASKRIDCAKVRVPMMRVPVLRTAIAAFRRFKTLTLPSPTRLLGLAPDQALGEGMR